MNKFQKLYEELEQDLNESLSMELIPVMNLKKECGNAVPVRAKTFDSQYNTAPIADILLAGGYLFEDHKSNSFAITAEDVAKVPGFGSLLQNNSTSEQQVKIGRKTIKFTKQNGNKCRATASIMRVNGDVVDPIVKNKLPSDLRTEIKSGTVVMSMKVPLSQEYVDGWYSADKEEKHGFYIDGDAREFNAILGSAYKIKGTDGKFVIFGQQHATKNSRFLWCNDGNRYPQVRYTQMSYRQMSAPRSYKKGALQDRKNGVYIAK